MKIFGRILGVLFVIAVMLLCVCSAFSQTSGNTPPPPPVCGSTNAGAIYTDTGTTPPTVYTCSYYNLEWQWNVNPIYGGLVYESSVPGTCSGALPVYVAGWPNTEVYVCENGIPEPIPSPGETVGVSGSITNGNCASWSSSNSITDAGFPCGSSSGTVSSGTAGQLAVYTGTTTVAGTSSPTMAGATVSGALTAGAVNGTINAAMQQTPTGTGNNGIVNSTADCLSNAYVCQIVAPALYAQAEAQPWGLGNRQLEGFYSQIAGPKTTDPVGCVTDDRWGGPEVLCNNGEALSTKAVGASLFGSTSISNGGGFYSSNQGLNVFQSSLSGNVDFYNNETGASGLQIFQQINAPTSTQLLSGYRLEYAPSDNITFTTHVYGTGSSLSQNEGNELWHGRAGEMAEVWSGTLSSYSCATSGDCTFVLSQTAGNPGGMGDGLALIDLTRADTSGYLAAINAGTSQITGSSGVDWYSTYGATTGITTTTAAVQDSCCTNTFPRASQVLSVAGTTGFSTGQVVGLFDNGNAEWECTKITAVGSGTITVAEMHWPLMSGSTVAAGGLTCYGFSLDADNCTSSTCTSDADDPIQSGTTIRRVMPILSNTSGNVLTVFAGSQNQGMSNMQLFTRAYAQMGGTGGTSTVTVSGGAVTSCTATGGSGYIGVNDPPQLVIAGITATTAPVIYVSGINAGALASCAVATPGAGISGTPTVSVVPTNAYHIFPQTRAWKVYNAATGALDGSSVQTTAIAGTFTNGDSVEQPHYFAGKDAGLNLAQSSYQSPGSGNMLSAIHYGNWGVNNYEAVLGNVNDATLYQGYPVSSAVAPYGIGAGQEGTPYGITLFGPHANGLWMQLPPYGANGNYPEAALFVDCIDSFTNRKVCNSWNQTIPVLGVANQNGSQYAGDIFGYNPVSTTWTLTSGATGRMGTNSAAQATLSPSGFVASNSFVLSGNYQNYVEYSGLFNGGSLASTWTNVEGLTLTGGQTDPYGGTSGVTVSGTAGQCTAGCFLRDVFTTSMSAGTVYDMCFLGNSSSAIPGGIGLGIANTPGSVYTAANVTLSASPTLNNCVALTPAAVGQVYVDIETPNAFSLTWFGLYISAESTPSIGYYATLGTALTTLTFSTSPSLAIQNQPTTFSRVTDSGLGGSTQCVESVAGVFTGTGAPCATNVSGGVLGSAVYQTGTGTTGTTAANTSSSTLCLTETGTGSVGAAPVWGSCAGSSATAFSSLTGSTNTSAAMVVGTGASLAASGSGTIAATSAPLSGLSGLGTGAATALGIAVNTSGGVVTNPVANASLANAAVTIGSTSVALGSTASTVAGLTLTSPTLTAPALGTPVSGVATNLTGTAAALNIGGNANTATALATTPAQCAGGQFATGVAASGNANCSTLATQAADTMLANMTASTAVPTAVAMPTTAHGVWLAEGTATAPSATAAGASASILMGQGAADPSFQTMSQDCTIGSTGVVTCLKTNNVAFTGYATAAYVADTTFTTATTAVAANSCDASATTVTMTGLTTSMAIVITPSSDTSSMTGWSPASAGQLYFTAWPSASNTLSYKRCNPTSSSITPGAVTWNVGAR